MLPVQLDAMLLRLSIPPLGTSTVCLSSWTPLGMLPVQLDAMLSVPAGRYAATGFAMITHFKPRLNSIYHVRSQTLPCDMLCCIMYIYTRVTAFHNCGGGVYNSIQTKVWLMTD